MKVEVLLFQWADADPTLSLEVDRLTAVFHMYGFRTEKWLIPCLNSHLKLMMKAASFVDTHEDEDCLMIVYYGGHSRMDAGGRSIWSM